MKNYLVLIILILAFQNGFCQDNSKRPPKYLLTISPQYIVINGTRVNVERRFNESNHAVLIAPTYYFGEISESHIFSNYGNYYDLNGFGVEIGHKIYSEKTWNKNVNWYQAYSITYNHLSFDYQGMDWVPFPDDPNLLILGEKEQTLRINQFGISTFLGAVVSLDKNFYTDIYFGIGAKRSIANDTSTDKFAEDDFKEGFINYNFTGALIRTGIKFGFVF